MNASPLLVWLGNISFAFYLIQFPVMVLVTRFLLVGGAYGGVGWLGWSALSLVLSMIAGAALYRWVDAPLMRRFAGWRPFGAPAPRPRPQPEVLAAGQIDQRPARHNAVLDIQP